MSFEPLYPVWSDCETKNVTVDFAEKNTQII